MNNYNANGISSNNLRVHYSSQSNRRRNSNSQLSSQVQLDSNLSSQRRQTLTEWTHQLGKMSEQPSLHFNNPRWGGQQAGYNGLYKHMSSMDHDHDRAQTVKKSQHKWKYKNDPSCIHGSELLKQEQRRQQRIGVGSSKRNSSNDINALNDNPYNIHISEIEIADITRCFIAADADQDDYLNCQELKKFMEYRGRPITHVEASRLLYQVDPTYHGFIDLDQIMFLVFHCGLSTSQEVRLASYECEALVNRLHRVAVAEAALESKRNSKNHQIHRHSSTSSSRSSQHQQQPQQHGVHHSHSTKSVSIIQDNIELDGAISYFEDMASNVQDKVVEEARYNEYRREIRESRLAGGKHPKGRRRGFGNNHNINDFNNDSDYDDDFDGEISKNYYPPPPGWKNMILHSQDPSCQVQVDFNKVKDDWQAITIASEQQKQSERDKFRTANIKQLKSNDNDDGGDELETNSIDKIVFPEPPPPTQCLSILTQQQQKSFNIHSNPTAAGNKNNNDNPKILMKSGEVLKPAQNSASGPGTEAKDIPPIISISNKSLGKVTSSKSFGTELREVLSLYRAKCDSREEAEENLKQQQRGREPKEQ